MCSTHRKTKQIKQNVEASFLTYRVLLFDLTLCLNVENDMARYGYAIVSKTPEKAKPYAARLGKFMTEGKLVNNLIDIANILSTALSVAEENEIAVELIIFHNIFHRVSQHRTVDLRNI